MPEVTLTPTDFSQAVNLASNSTFVSLLDNWRDILYEKGYVEAFQKHLSGAVGEIAFAKWSWSYPTCSVNNFSGMGHDAMHSPILHCALAVEGVQRRLFHWSLRSRCVVAEERLSNGITP